MLTKADFPQLQKIQLSIQYKILEDECNISNCGTINLTKAKWPNLKSLNLGSNYSIKIQMKLGLTDLSL